MKKLFLIGIIFISSLGFSVASTQETKTVTICWENSCGQIHCSVFYLDETLEDLVNEMERSDETCE
jgi:hypothetical protein